MATIDDLTALLADSDPSLDEGAANFVAIIGRDDPAGWTATRETFEIYGKDALSYRVADYGDRLIIQVWFPQIAAESVTAYRDQRLADLDRRST